VGVLTPICVANFQQQTDAAAKLVAFNKISHGTGAQSSRRAVGLRCLAPTSRIRQSSAPARKSSAA
jgi:hypothetical protein